MRTVVTATRTEQTVPEVSVGDVTMPQVSRNCFLAIENITCRRGLILSVGTIHRKSQRWRCQERPKRWLRWRNGFQPNRCCGTLRTRKWRSRMKRNEFNFGASHKEPAPPPDLFHDSVGERLRSAGYEDCRTKWGRYWLTPDRKSRVSEEQALLRLEREKHA